MRSSGVWVGLGSVTYNEFDAVERLNLQLGLAPGLDLHAEVRNDRDRDSAVTRAVADLFLRVRFAKHPDYRVEGDDLYCDLDLAPWEAVLGAQVSVPTLCGRIGIKIPPGAQSMQKMRVRGHGLPLGGGGRGDLYVVLRIQVPERIGERERTLWEQLARESRFNPRD